MEHNGRLTTGAWIQVNIGRNVGTEPMSTDAWADFQQRIVRVLRCFADVPAAEVMHTVGTGPWEDGQREDCASFGVFAPSGSDVDWLRGQIRRMAGIFRQDAIALMIGGELINAAA